MGVQGLLKAMQPIAGRPNANICEYAGSTLAIDASSWLHRAGYACAEPLVETVERYKAHNNGDNTDTSSSQFVKTGKRRRSHNSQFPAAPTCDPAVVASLTKYLTQRCQELFTCANIHSILLVFDGPRRCPLKQATNADRERKRALHLAAARQFKKEGKHKQAEERYRLCAHVPHDLAVTVVQSLRKQYQALKCSSRVQCLFSPYEADAQLVQLCMQGHANAIVTEDSDLMVYLAAVNVSVPILYKLDRRSGGCTVYTMDWLLTSPRQPPRISHTSNNKENVRNNTPCSKLNRTPCKSNSKKSPKQLTECLSYLALQERRHPGAGRRMFVQACVLAGCDYTLGLLPGVGIMTAFKLVKEHAGRKANERLKHVVRSVLGGKSGGGQRMEEMDGRLAKAEAVFYYHYVYCTERQRVVPLLPISKSNQGQKDEMVLMPTVLHGDDLFLGEEYKVKELEELKRKSYWKDATKDPDHPKTSNQRLLNHTWTKPSSKSLCKDANRIVSTVQRSMQDVPSKTPWLQQKQNTKDEINESHERKRKNPAPASTPFPTAGFPRRNNPYKKTKTHSLQITPPTAKEANNENILNTTKTRCPTSKNPFYEQFAYNGLEKDNTQKNQKDSNLQVSAKDEYEKKEEPFSTNVFYKPQGTRKLPRRVTLDADTAPEGITTGMSTRDAGFTTRSNFTPARTENGEEKSLFYENGVQGDEERKSPLPQRSRFFTRGVSVEMTAKHSSPSVSRKLGQRLSSVGDPEKGPKEVPATIPPERNKSIVERDDQEQMPSTSPVEEPQTGTPGAAVVMDDPHHQEKDNLSPRLVQPPQNDSLMLGDGNFWSDGEEEAQNENEQFTSFCYTTEACEVPLSPSKTPSTSTPLYKVVSQESYLTSNGELQVTPMDNTPRPVRGLLLKKKSLQQTSVRTIRPRPLRSKRKPNSKVVHKAGNFFLPKSGGNPSHVPALGGKTKVFPRAIAGRSLAKGMHVSPSQRQHTLQNFFSNKAK